MLMGEPVAVDLGACSRFGAGLLSAWLVWAVPGVVDHAWWTTRARPMSRAWSPTSAPKHNGYLGFA